MREWRLLTNSPSRLSIRRLWALEIRNRHNWFVVTPLFGIQRCSSEVWSGENRAYWFVGLFSRWRTDPGDGPWIFNWKVYRP